MIGVGCVSSGEITILYFLTLFLLVVALSLPSSVQISLAVLPSCSLCTPIHVALLCPRDSLSLFAKSPHSLLSADFCLAFLALQHSTLLKTNLTTKHYHTRCNSHCILFSLWPLLSSPQCILSMLSICPPQTRMPDAL